MVPARSRLHIGIALLALVIGALGALLCFQVRDSRRAARLPIEPHLADDPRAGSREAPPGAPGAPAVPREPGALAAPESAGAAGRTGEAVPSFELLVVDPDGAPVDGARIVLVREGAVLAQGASGADGIARFPLLESAAESVVAAPGWELARLWLEPGPGRRTIALAEGAEISGTARVEGSPPAAPFELHWRPDAGSAPSGIPAAALEILADGAMPTASARVRVRADGSFRLRGLRAGATGELAWSAPWFLAGVEHEFRAREVLLVAPRADVLLELTEGCELRLRVVDPAGTPLPRAHVELRRERKEASSGSGRRAVADAEGRFRHALRPVAGETFSVLVAESPGAAARRHDLARPAVLRGTWDVGDLMTPATRAVTLVVQDPEGRPLAGAQARPWPSAEAGGAPRTASGADGRVQVLLGADGRRVAAEALGFASAVVGVAPDATELAVRLERVGMLEFVLEGAGQAGLAVEVLGRSPLFEDELGGQPAEGPRTARVAPGVGLIAMTEVGAGVVLRPSAGFPVRLAGLRPGEPLRARLLAGPDVLCEVDVDPLRPGEHRGVPLRVERAGTSLLVNVVSPSGQPVGGARILRIEGDRQRVLTTKRTDARGACELQSLHGERCVFVVHAEPFAPKRVELQPIPASPYVVELETAAELEVELVDPAGAPFTGPVELDVLLDPACRLRKSALGPGLYRVLGVPHGDVLLELSGDFVPIARMTRAGEPRLRMVVGLRGSLYVAILGDPDPRDDGWMLSVARTGSTRELARSPIHHPGDREPFSVVHGLAADSYEVGFVRRSGNGPWTRAGVTRSVVLGDDETQARIELELPR